MAAITNVSFIGARGAGKSRLSRKLSKLTGRLALSTDSLISYEADGWTISSIVDREGWSGFRDREYEILKKLTGMTELLIDCGGGILIEAPDPKDPHGVEPVSTRKWDLLKKNTRIVYIKRSVPFLLSKVKKGDPNRPDLVGEYERLLSRRLPMYEKAADFVVDLELLDTDQALESLQNFLRNGLNTQQE